MAITMAMLEQLKANIAELAAVLDCSMEQAFEAAMLPDWIWSEMAAARDAAGPPPAPTMDLFAAESPEREAAANAVFNHVRSFVVGTVKS